MLRDRMSGRTHTSSEDAYSSRYREDYAYSSRYAPASERGGKHGIHGLCLLLMRLP